MNRRAQVLHNGQKAAVLEQTNRGYWFAYHAEYLADPGARAVSLTLPLRREPYESAELFPFFTGLLAEGTLKEMQCRLYKIDPHDDYSRLLKTTSDDVIGAVTLEELPE